MPYREILIGIIPSIGVFVLFWFVMRNVIRADRNERQALQDIEDRQAAESTQESAETQDL